MTEERLHVLPLLGTKGGRRCFFLLHLVELGDEKRGDSSCSPRLNPEPSLGAFVTRRPIRSLGKRGVVEREPRW